MENEFNAELMLVERILKGERQLFHNLVQPYENRVYLAALAILQNEADAEDVAQDAFLKAFTHLHQFRAEAKFSTWLISITGNEARRRIRTNTRRRTESLDADPVDQSFSPAILTDWKEVPLIALENKELQQLLRDVIAELPTIYREVFAARDIDGFSVAETAQILGISVAATKVRLHRARMMLQRRLAPYLKNRFRRARRWPWF